MAKVQAQNKANVTREKKIEYINKNLKRGGKTIPKRELNNMETEELDAIISKFQDSFDKWLSMPKVIEYMWCNDNYGGIVRAESVDKAKEILKSENMIATKIVTKKGHHTCKYCGGIADGSNAKVLCEECREVFGHYIIDEL